MKDDLKYRTKKFALDCIKLSNRLPNTVLGRHVKGQLIRSGTSVAANYRAANLGQTKALFTSKISIVIEEADESEFWLEIIEEERLIVDPEVTLLKNEAHEIASILISSRKTIMQGK